MAHSDDNIIFEAGSTGTSVHPQETSGDFPVETSYRARRIARCREEYQASEEMYFEIDRRDWKHRGDSLWQCKTDAWLAVNNRTRTVSVLSYSCRLRWCPLCSQSRAHTIANNVSLWLRNHPRPKLLTLTLKHSADALDLQISRLYACFQSFKKVTWLKQNIRGGIWFFQIKWIEETQEWHPHLHILLDSEYLPHASLKTTWHKITGDSDIVDIRVIYKPQTAADYVARYAARPALLHYFDLAKRIELFDALHGRRICGKWGTASVVSFRTHEDFKSSEWTSVVRFRTVFQHMETSAFARLLWKCYTTGEPVPLSVDLEFLDNDDGPESIGVTIEANPPPAQLRFPYSPRC